MTDRIPFDTVSAPAIPLRARGFSRFRKYYLLALLMLAASLAVTHQLWRNSQQHALQTMQTNFDFSVREAGTRIEQRMAAYEHILHSAEGFMSQAEVMTRIDFRNFVEKLHLGEKYPGIQALSFLQIVPAAQKERHIAAIRRAGFPAYAIHPDGERSVYTPVTYIEPFSVMNRRAFGHDPYSEASRRAAMEQARDLDLPVISGKVTLVQENTKDMQAGFLMYLPVFKFGAPRRSVAERRAGIIGWVSAPFRMHDLMEGLHGEQAGNLDIEIFDGEEVSGGALMYDVDHDYVDGKQAAGLFTSTTRIKIANHPWTMKVRSLPAYDARLDRDSPRYVAYSGVGISLLLALLTMMLVNGRERALQAARKMNRELIESETRYRQMFENNTSIVYLLEPDSGRIVDANAAAAAFWGYPLEQLRNMNIAEINTAPRASLIKKMHQVGAGESINMEWRHILKNGELRDVEVFSSPLAYRGKVLQYSILHDISARRHAEQALLESEVRSREITATIGEGVVVTDSNGIITFCNPEAQNLLGWQMSELLGQNGHALLHHSHADGTPFPAHECEIRRVVESGVPFRSHDETFWRKDGSMLPVSVHATPIIRDWQVVGSVLAFHDTIRRKQAQRALENESAKNAMLLRTASDGIHVLDPLGNILQANDALCRMLGYSQDELQSMNVAQCDAQWSATELQGKFRQLLGQDTLFETRLRRRDGSIFDVEVHACGVVINDKELLYASARDITERKKVAQALENESAKNAMLLRTASDGIHVLDPLGNVVLANDAFCRMLGYTREELQGVNVSQWNVEYSAEEIQKNFHLLLDRDALFETRHRHRDGSMIDVEIHTRGVVIGGTQLLYAAARDITARKKAEQALADESTMNAMLLRTASDGIYVLDPLGDVVLANDAFCSMLGYTLEELQGMNMTQLDAQWSAKEIQKNFHTLLDKDVLFETSLRCCDGSFVDAEIHAGCVVIGGKRLLYAAARDITERRKAAQRLEHLAHFDILTDLPNRALLNDRLNQLLAKARRDHTRMALMFLDLDKFKPVNDRLGHGVGDLLLQEAAVRMQRCLRESDTVARVGGDEFVVLLPSIENENGAQLVAQKILSALEQSFPLAGEQIHISASIGIAIYPEHGEDEHLLVKSADQAMYHAKNAGGSAFRTFGDLACQVPSAVA